MKKTEYTLEENELLIVKKDGTELRLSYKLMVCAMISIALAYFLGNELGVLIGNIFFN